MFLVGCLVLWLTSALLALWLGMLVPYLIICLTLLGAVMMWIDRPHQL